MGFLLVGSLYPCALLHHVNIFFRKNVFVVYFRALAREREHVHC
jgi:hypothetical protein